MTITIKGLKETIEKHRGNISLVARSFGVSRTTIYKHLNKHPELKVYLADEREKMIDNVESVLYNQALDGNITAVIFFLKTQGKNRGYIERQEITGKDGEPQKVEVEYINSPIKHPELSPGSIRDKE